MSGFVVARGQAAPVDVKRMFERIRHRGSYLSGTYDRSNVVAAQNYLRADCPLAERGAVEVPVGARHGSDLRICYDGQMGDSAALAREAGVASGPFLEERALLQLYSDKGSAMLERLNDAIFAFVIIDGDEILAARDLLGIKTLFYGWRDRTLYLASELKSLLEITEDVHEFPPGHFMDSAGRLTRFASLPQTAPEPWPEGPDAIADRVYEIIDRSVRSRVDFVRPTACLLSGGMDSSAVTHFAAKLHRERFGSAQPITTYTVGAAGSTDIANARIMAEHVGSEHRELTMDLDLALEVLPAVIYAVESFDPSLVRSAVSNFLISRQASRDGFEILLSGEGGDEIFCGYTYLKDSAAESLFARQMDCLRFLHNNAALRLDHANLCNSIRVVAPLISGELFDYSLSIPAEYKQGSVDGQKLGKWIFRKALKRVLPEAITQRVKQEFSEGSGSAQLLPQHFESVYSDAELAEVQAEYPVVRRKEELHYFRLFTERFGTGRAIQTVGQWPYL
jgi:asparagine synthase (glutamine-hydrolysing)